MNTFRKVQHLLWAVFLLAPYGLASADWELDSASSTIHFVSVKNVSVGEVHSFASLVGFIGAAGNAQVTVDLNSVQTLIDIRNERMRELLFETAKFPVATVSAQVDPSVLALASEGGVLTVEVPVTLSLHGQEKTLTTSLVVVGESEGRLRVFSAAPILVNAADFGLVPGVEALQKIVGLQSIATAIPVTLQLQFVQAK
jgi:polyisoprenoid-binding protein YceI